MKAFILMATTLFSFSAFSESIYQEKYICTQTNGTDIGTITLFGDPIENIYSEVTINNDLKAFRYGVTDRGYLYLFDDKVRGTKSYSLEIVNYPANYNQFELLIYSKDQIVLGSRSIAKYSCILK